MQLKKIKHWSPILLLGIGSLVLACDGSNDNGQIKEQKLALKLKECLGKCESTQAEDCARSCNIVYSGMEINGICDSVPKICTEVCALLKDENLCKQDCMIIGNNCYDAADGAGNGPKKSGDQPPVPKDPDGDKGDNGKGGWTTPEPGDAEEGGGCTNPFPQPIDNCKEDFTICLDKCGKNSQCLPQCDQMLKECQPQVNEEGAGFGEPNPVK
jgi:hypothetical protein